MESFNTLYGLLLLFLGGKVNIKNLDTILSNLEIKLADSELKDLTQNIHADGKYVIRYGSYHEESLVENYWVYIMGEMTVSVGRKEKCGDISCQWPMHNECHLIYEHQVKVEILCLRFLKIK